MSRSTKVPNYQKKLQTTFSSADSAWEYTVPDLPIVDDHVPTEADDCVILKFLSFSDDDGMTLSFNKQKLNRILTLDRPSKFCAVSFSQLKLRNLGPGNLAKYIENFLVSGITLNGVLYKCFGWSNSQLKSRSCLFYAFAPDEDPLAKLNKMGEFNSIPTIAKKSKRIGLLFSEAELGLKLPESCYRDIPDIEANGHIFTDGCGFMSTNFAARIAREKKLIFRGVRYTPRVVQIRYRGYKGILMVNADLKSGPPVHFRKSMRKFAGCEDDTLSVLEYSKPYAFGKLNGELITLLSSLGITDDVFLRKQQEYFDLISKASVDPLQAFIFMSYMGYQNAAESLFLNGLESIGTKLKTAQHEAWAKMYDKKGEEKGHIMVPQSRLLFGVCDPTGPPGILQPNECHVRISVEGGGVRSLDNAFVIVARNPCLHPGDIRKLRVRYVKKLEYLVDCIVFSTRGNVPAPSMMSGGDLDGDKFFVCWDRDLIPTMLHEPHHYPAAKEKPRHHISHQDLLRYFARFNNASLGRVKNLYLDWVKVSKEGAGSQQCQQLNHLFSCCVDGEPIKIPEPLTRPPRPEPDSEPFILQKLADKVAVERATLNFGLRSGIAELSLDAMELLAAADEICLDEFELFQLVRTWSVRNNVSMSQFINHFDFGAFTTEQKAWIRRTSVSGINASDLDRLLQNGLLQSRILTRYDLKQYCLQSPLLHWRRIYSAEIDGDTLFLPMLATALEDFTCKLLVLNVDARLSIAILITKRINPNEDRDETPVDDSVSVYSFRPNNKSRGRYKRTVEGYRLGWDGVVFQLFLTSRADTFIHFRASETEAQGPLGRVSIALNKVNAELAKNVGRVYRNPILQVEFYIISNRDRIGHQILNISHNNVPTEIYIPRITNTPAEYEEETLETVDWPKHPPIVRSILLDKRWDLLNEATPQEQDEMDGLCCRIQNLTLLISLVQRTFGSQPLDALEKRLVKLLKLAPRICVLLTDIAEDESRHGRLWTNLLQSSNFTKAYVTALIKSANYAPGLAAALLTDSLKKAVALEFDSVLDLISIIPISIRSTLLAIEFITILHDYAIDVGDRSDDETSLSRPEVERLVSLARNVSIDRCAEAEEICKCDDWGITLNEKGDCMVDSIEIDETGNFVKAFPRVDLKHSFRVGDHVRLRSASAPINNRFRSPRVLDGLVQRAGIGQLTIELMEPAPPDRCSWYILPAGNNTTAKGMIKAIRALAGQRECCGLYGQLIKGVSSSTQSSREPIRIDTTDLNSSQGRAVSEAVRSDLTLVHGPPGTGKTSTVVRIIREWRNHSPDETILVTASTNNAVDNVLEKFVSEAGGEDIVRVCPDASALSKAAARYWVGAFVEGDINRPSAAMKEAQRKVMDAKIIFTTCTGAGLGLLRKMTFSYVIVDEASQITEPNSLIPLVKGCKKAVLVGDHVQLRPTVTQLGEAYEHNVSLFERLYNAPDIGGVSKVMLDVQYRMHPEIAKFPSSHFYGGKLTSGVTAAERELMESEFDWEGRHIVFRQSDGLESFFHGSKKNEEQGRLCRQVVTQLRTRRISGPSDDINANPISRKMSIAVLTPYTAQLELLKSLAKNAESETISSITVATVDSFQGREADIVIFCTVRHNVHRNIGFLADERRINVALTRAKRGLIVIGNRDTLVKSEEGNQIWKSWFRSIQS